MTDVLGGPWKICDENIRLPKWEVFFITVKIIRGRWKLIIIYNYPSLSQCVIIPHLYTGLGITVDNSVENVDNLGRTKIRTQNNGSESVTPQRIIKHSVISGRKNDDIHITIWIEMQKILHGFYIDFANV